MQTMTMTVKASVVARTVVLITAVGSRWSSIVRGIWRRGMRRSMGRIGLRIERRLRHQRRSGPIGGGVRP